MARRLDYYLERLVGEEQQTFHQAIHDFVDDAIAPRWLEWERGHQLIPDDAIAQMAEMGLFGVTVSEEYGG